MFGIYEMQKRSATGYTKRLSDQQIAAVRNSRAWAPAGDHSSSHPSASPPPKMLYDCEVLTVERPFQFSNHLSIHPP
jgi:hypothetical protein